MYRVLLSSGTHTYPVLEGCNICIRTYFRSFSLHTIGVQVQTAISFCIVHFELLPDPLATYIYLCDHHYPQTLLSLSSRHHCPHPQSIITPTQIKQTILSGSLIQHPDYRQLLSRILSLPRRHVELPRPGQSTCAV